MRTSYYATRISENIGKTPEGYLLCKNCVLARTGFQTYSVHDVTKDLSDEDVESLGLAGANPNSSLDLYRPADEVFAAATIASAEGKPLTDEHPSEFVNPDNYRDYARGHVQNVRKGSTVLESGDWPLIGDILVTDPDVIEKINNGVRELSCGYSHELIKEKGKICQIKIVVNHVALVRKGRAGPEARINDSLEAGSAPKKSVAQRAGGDKVRFNSLEKKMAKDKGTIFSRLLGMGIRAMAQDEDTSPEELAAATKELHEKTQDEQEMLRREEDSHRRDSGKCAPGVLGHEKCSDDTCRYDRAKHDDSKHDGEGDERVAETDDRAKHHAMLDRILDKMGKKSKDSDVEELKKLLGDFLSEEEAEPAHAQDEEEGEEEELVKDKKSKDRHKADDDDEESDPEIIEPIAEDDAEDEEMEEELMTKNDAAMNLLPLVEKSRSASVKKAFDSALENSLDSEKKFLSKFRPFVAKSKDSSLISAFNGESRRVNGRSHSSDASYTGFGFAAKSRPKRNDSSDKHDYAALEAAYEKIRNGEEK